MIQVYTPTSDYDDKSSEQFYIQLQGVTDKVNKKDILMVQGDWNAKDAQWDWSDHSGSSCNTITNNQGRLLLEEDEEDADMLMNMFNAVMTETAKDILWNYHLKKKTWVTDEIHEICDAWRELKNVRHSTGAAEYKEISKKIRKSMKWTKEEWVEKQCAEIEESLGKNNSRKVFQIVKDLTN